MSTLTGSFTYNAVDIPLNQFLAEFFPNEDEPIHVRALPPKGDEGTKHAIKLRYTRRQLQDPAIISHLRSLNETRGIYFVVNSGGDSDDEITRYNAFFAEYDDLPVDEQVQRFKTAPVLPSILNVTKKSVHAYWLLRGSCSTEEWEDGQERIISHLHSDPYIKNPARLMRLPGFNHVSKKKEDGTLNYKIVECVLFEPSRRYTVKDMRNVFPPVVNKKSKVGWLPYNKPVGESERNSTLYRRACYYSDLGWDEEDIAAHLLIDNKRLCTPPLSEDEVCRIARNARTYAKGSGFNMTELGNAKRLIARHGHNLRYCKKLKCWFVWKGKFWQEDETGEVERMVKETVLSIYEEAFVEKDRARREELAMWAMRSESEKIMQATISMAKSEPGVSIHPKEFDRNRMLLNTESGTLDLTSGELNEHRREDLITRIIPAEYDLDAVCPKFDAFLLRVMNGNKDLIRFLKRLVGYSLTGRMDEQIMVIFHGEGANGKTTLIETLMELFGDYVVRTAPETFMVKPFGGMPNDLPRLKGARLVTATEGEEGQRLAESFIKQVTGGDTVTARKLYCEPFQFKPECKLILATNHIPEVRGTDHAIWRRIKLVPFKVTIPEEERDKQLAEKLRAELPGILRWAVEGCLEWQREGLTYPEAVKDATAKYRDEMDTIKEFLEERCEEKPYERIEKGLLYGEYTSWCKANGIHPLRKPDFGSRLKKRGIQELKSGKHYWVGLELRADDPLSSFGTPDPVPASLPKNPGETPS